MIATLRFTLPEETTEHLASVHAIEILSALHEVVTHVRNRVKYAELGVEAREELEQIRRLLVEQVADLPEALRS